MSQQYGKGCFMAKKTAAVAFGPRLKQLREGAGLTQAQLAERAGLHPQGIVKLERNEREPAWGTVLALADALGVSCDDFRRAGSTAAAEPPPPAPGARSPRRPRGG
jgi:transcriptional regulator with XRE-family HTH domain